MLDDSDGESDSKQEAPYLPETAKTLGSMITLLPDKFKFAVIDRRGPGFAIIDSGPDRTPPQPPKTKADLTMIEVGFITGDCPPVVYRSAKPRPRAGLVACARVALDQAGGQDYKLCSKSGHVLPENSIHFFQGFTPGKISALAAEARDKHDEYWLAAYRQYILAYHQWYWERFAWEASMVLHALQYGRVVWPLGNPIHIIEDLVGKPMVWQRSFLKAAVKGMKEKFGREPQMPPAFDEMNRTLDLEIPPPKQEDDENNLAEFETFD
jgi:hypothetical protein